MPNTMPNDSELLLATEAPSPYTPAVPGAERRNVRLIMALVVTLAAVGFIGTWMLGTRGGDLEAMSADALTQDFRVVKAYGYNNVGKGGCLLPNGDEPVSRYSGIKENRAQLSCDADPGCAGYVVSSGCRGAFLYDNADGTVTGGGGPPKSSHTWKTSPCMAKDLSMVYNKMGHGKCVTDDGKEPEHEFLEDANEMETREKCSNDPTCMGFSAATMNFKGGYLWKAKNLMAGGRSHRWNVCSCYMKEEAETGEPIDVPVPAPAPEEAPAPPAPPSEGEPATAPTGDDVTYQNLGRNKCTNAEGTAMKHGWMGRGSERDIAEKCNEDEQCYGYSASKWGGGLLWKEGGLQKGGNPWGGCSCMVKEM